MREKSATSSPARGPVPRGAGGPSVIGLLVSLSPECPLCGHPSVVPQSRSGRWPLSRRGASGPAPRPTLAARGLDLWPRSQQGVGGGARPQCGRPSAATTTSRRRSMSLSDPARPAPEAGRPLVFRGGTVLTMDASCTVLADADVLVVDDRIAAVGPALDVPEGTAEIDARGGIVMPGMIDTHRHMWQTAMRGYGADWTLTQYFVWYYLEHGKKFRPEDIAAGNRLAAIESLDAGVTTTVDWSHNLQSVEHAEGALDALRSVPGRFVLAYGNIQAGPWEWTADPAVRSFLERLRDARDDMMGVQIAFDVTGDPAFPEKAAFEVARDLGIPVTTHAGVWGATSDTGIQQMYDGGFMTPETTYVHASTLTRDSYQRIAATGGSISVATESECSAGQGHAPTEQVLQYGIPVSLSMDTSVWWSGDMFSAMRATLN